MAQRKKLLIVESPAKAKTITKYLGGAYIVKASVGHIRDLPKSNKKAIDIEGGFIPHYEVVRGKERVISELKEAAAKADEVVLATDPDREGEAIAWHLKELVGLKKPKRIVFHEITKEAIEEALAHPRVIDENLRRAQEARRVLDRLVGYDLSGLIWKKVRYGLSAGRVQSPALRIIMEREREIRAFKPEDYFVITADVETQKKEKLTLTCVEEPQNYALAEKILEVGKAGVWNVSDIVESQMNRVPRPPFITSTLQQTASSRLGFAPSKTMGIAQKLYEAGHITYMRTDSTAMSIGAQQQILSLVKQKFGQEYATPRVYKTTSKSAQEAHEAIRPTNVAAVRAGTTEEQHRLYALIWGRTVASQMTDAKLLKTKIVTNVIGGDIPNFVANGSRTLFDGWLKADPAARGDDVELPKVVMSETLTLIEIHSEAKQTQPPSRYTEAGLIKELEKRGIGRPSTYASIMKTLSDRGYVEKQGRTLYPTDVGDVVSSFLEQHFDNYISDTFTAEMEDELDQIAEGKREYTKTLKDFYGPFTKEVKSKEKMEKITNLGDAPSEFKCPKCGSPMIWKLSRGGKFMSCSRFPECSGARTNEGKELEGPKETGELCPLCGDLPAGKAGKLVEREGRFGKFIACSNYPKCKYLKGSGNGLENSTGVKCPVCKEGEMIPRRGRFGIFYSCSNYPKCKNAIKAKPTGNICSQCGSLMMEGTKTIPERCSDKNCPNHNPHKIAK
ncbi:DNA topoisomerase I [Candidatus Kaiserbacteria bacterium RIFCSPLOWO2_01_FULL_51_21]|uniref:DNA topoisomerase 1 n=1 Tax=Candidatus Kaiserbacteria bacterium RIFCSPLOWO2_01_FULL_51_21 TaxID=1798508 RepID=A0A1F6ED38_9BACT|nr:MAG: DNA topoisomerase I [Candidatus Kaiserbacteria bacterium RIFCSPLOWO2_01_FULL_51_21]